MKKIIVFLTVVLGGLQSNAQVGPVFQYTTPSKSEILDLATSQTPKGKAFARYLISQTNVGLKDTSYRVSSVEEIFQNLYWEDVTLIGGTYINSGYDPQKGRMVPSIGNAWSGFAWVYRVGTFVIPLLKGDCANVLTGLGSRLRITLTSPVIIPSKIPSDNRLLRYESTEKKQLVPFTPTANTQVPQVEKKKFPWVLVIVGSVVTTTGIYFLAKGSPDRGGPAGAPATVLPPAGGPAGAPPTTGR
ncbi:MAG: hypothetical protein V4665_01430 [Patescibacteria group bacterium]